MKSFAANAYDHIATVLARIYLPDNPSAAISLLKRAVTLYPTRSKIHATLADAYRSSSRWQESIQHYRLAADLDPKNFAFRRAYGFYLLKLGDYEQAIAQYRYCIDHWQGDEKSPVIANTYAMLGTCQTASGQWSTAEAAFEFTQDTAAWDLDLLSGRVGLYYASARLDEIPRTLDKYEDAYPGYYPVDVFRGHFQQYFLYSLPEALISYARALSRWNSLRNRKFADQYYTSIHLFDMLLREYAEALVNSGEPVRAWAVVHHHEGWAADRRDLRRREAYYQLLVKNYAEAERLCCRVLERERIVEPEVYAMLATAGHKSGRDEDAMRAIEHALALDDRSLDALDALGSLQKDRAEWMAAARTYEKIMALSPFSAGWLADLGTCYKNLQQIELARATYENVVKLDPYNADAWLELGQIYLALNQNDLADSACKRALSFNRLAPEKKDLAQEIAHSSNSTN